MLRRRFLQTVACGAAVALGPSGRPARAAAPRLADERIVVLGGGFAGAQAASDIKRIAPQLDVTLVDTVPRGVDTPADLATTRHLLAKS